jgi:hypothetical protein
MAVTTALLNSCRTQILASAEYAAFRAAYASYASASRASRPAYWQAAYGDNQPGLSPAYRLRKFARETVAGLADATVTAGERETAYQTLAAEYVPNAPQPLDAVQERSLTLQTLVEDALS